MEKHAFHVWRYGAPLLVLAAGAAALWPFRHQLTAEAIAAFLEANFLVKHRDLSLDLNYQLDKPRLTLRAALSLTVAQLLAIVLPLGWAVVKTICNRRKQRQEAATAAPERKGEANHGKEPSCQ